MGHLTLWCGTCSADDYRETRFYEPQVSITKTAGVRLFELPYKRGPTGASSWMTSICLNIAAYWKAFVLCPLSDIALDLAVPGHNIFFIISGNVPYSLKEVIHLCERSRVGP